jgi:hypothetical protein
MNKAHVDLQTEEIFGCIPGTKQYYHEEGHIAFNKDVVTSFYGIIDKYCFDGWMLFIMAAIMFRWALNVAIILFAIHIFIGLYEEVWCNKYAMEKLKNDNI